MYEGPGMDLEIEHYIKDLRSAKEAEFKCSIQEFSGQEENTEGDKNREKYTSNQGQFYKFIRLSTSTNQRRCSTAQTSSSPSFKLKTF